MDHSGFDDLTKSLIESLQAVSQSTEKVYLEMGSAYPALVRELDARFGSRSSDSGEPPQELLIRTIKETQQTIEEHERDFAEHQEEGRQLLDRLTQQLGALGALGTHVAEIREDSVLMELISLNAMVVAAKAGVAGRAFGCITSELKQLSNQTRDLTEQVARREANLDGTFGDFQKELDKMNAGEGQALSGFIGRIHQVFDALETLAQTLVGDLSAIHRRSDEIKTPLVRIVVEIQNQDRIRQSIDHVLISLREFQTASRGTDLESRLDALAYLQILPDLAIQVLDEVGEQLRANQGVFDQSLTQARTLIDGLEQARGRFQADRLEDQRPGSLDRTFADGQDQFEEFLAQTAGLARYREGTLRRSGQLQRNVVELVGSLQAFDALISKFRNIDLASRIQVARQSALASMRDNASATSDLTRKIEKDVSQAIAVASGFSTTVQALFETYRDQFAARVKQEGIFENELEEAVTRLKEAKEFLSRSLRDSHLFTDEFTRRFERTRADLETLGGLQTTIGTQKDQLSSIKARITEEKRRLMADHGLTEWNLDKAKLKAMVEGFTIFTHKKFAANLGNFEIDSSVASGDVTLF